MEVIEIITKLISNVGFPIACCIILFIQNGKFTQAINENTMVLKDLAEKVRRDDDN